jgi:pimeloyl-ACP methyl ester carboxylesterase
VSIPVHLVAGKNDRMIHPDDATAVAPLLPGAASHVLDEFDHYSMIETSEGAERILGVVDSIPL